MSSITWKGPVYPYGAAGRDEPGDAFISENWDATPHNRRPGRVAMCRKKIIVHETGDGGCYVHLEETTRANKDGPAQTRTITYAMPADMWKALKAYKP